MMKFSRIDAVAVVAVIVTIAYAARSGPVPICLQMIFQHPIGVTLALLAVIAAVMFRPAVGVAAALVFLVLNDMVMNGAIISALRRRDGFSDFYTIVEEQDSGVYNRIIENRVLENQTNCDNPSHKNLADAIKACDVCKDCTGITYMNGDFELRKGPGIVEAPTDTIATTWLKPEDPKLKGDYIGLNLPGANEEITRSLVPNCRMRCDANDINKEFQEKRMQFFGLPKDTPDMPIVKTAFEPNETKPTLGGGKWAADETYMRVPDVLDRCSVSYLLDPDSRNEWVMDAYMNPMEKCRIQVMAQNADNVFDGKTVPVQDAYGGPESLFGPMAFRESN
jgi:hypothetical protein